MELNRFSPHRAFSLVEITIALGIFAFVLVSMLGLMGASLSAERTADFDTVVSRMAQNTNAWVKGGGLDSLKPTNGGLVGIVANLYFDGEGMMLRSTVDGHPVTGASAPADAKFRGEIRTYEYTYGYLNGIAKSAIGLRSEFSWLPATAPTAVSEYTWTFVTTIPKP